MSLPVGDARRAYVQEMFTRIAPRYDLLNTLLTLGLDRTWRNAVRDAAALQPNALALDIGTGTGRLADCLRDGQPSARVFGVDLALGMLRVGLAAEHDRIGMALPTRVAAADALALPFDDGTLDCVVSAFTIRNLADVAAGVREQLRVLRPGGRLVCLELADPAHPATAALFRAYFRTVAPVAGRLIAGAADAYTYLPDSVAAFMPPSRLAKLMRAEGLQSVRWRRLHPGTVALYTGVKPVA